MIVCEPLLKDQNAAVVLLESHAHQDHPAVVLVGAQEALEECISKMEAENGEWSSVGEVLTGIKQAAKSVKCSVAWERQNEAQSDNRPEGPYDPPDKEGVLDYDLSDEDEDEENPEDIGHPMKTIVENTVTAAVRPPKQGKYPVGINDLAKDLWDNVLKSYKKTIQGYDKPEEQWAVAIIIFRRAAARKGLVPFARVLRDPARDAVVRDIAKRIEAANAIAAREVQTTFDKLKAQGLVSRSTKEHFHECVKHKGRFSIVTMRKVTPKKGVAPQAVIKTLDEYGYIKGKAWAYRELDRSTEVMWEVQETGSIFVYLKTFLTKDQLIVFLGVDEKSKESELLKDLARVARKWVKTRELDPQKVLAALAFRGHEDLAESLNEIRAFAQGTEE